jgi:hypothetical protein
MIAHKSTNHTIITINITIIISSTNRIKTSTTTTLPSHCKP